MNAFLMFPALIFGIIGADLLGIAEGIASRRKDSIWTSAKPEFGGAILAFGVAIVCAIGAAPWWLE